MSYKDDFGAALAQNKVLEDELKRAQERLENTGPREIPDLDDLMLEVLMGWENGIEWLFDGRVILLTQKGKGGTQFGIAFKPKWKKVKVFVASNETGWAWDHYRDIHVVKGKKAKTLKQALSYSYIKFGSGVKYRSKKK